jgi:two-component system, OmpR family, sensor histidine kinase ChvG
MTLKRQLLFVSLLTLMLPWAGCEFIRETELALRASQQQILSGTAQVVANSLSRYAEEFPERAESFYRVDDSLYGHPLETTPNIDGYFEDWPLDESSLRSLDGDNSINIVTGVAGDFLYLFVKVKDKNVVYANAGSLVPIEGSRPADRVCLVSTNPGYLEERFWFAAEAPGPVVTMLPNELGFKPEPSIRAHWQDVPGGYQLEARIPRNRLGTHLGVIVDNAASPTGRSVRHASFSLSTPGPFVTPSDELAAIAEGVVQPGMRLILTDTAGWRIAAVGDLNIDASTDATTVSTWLRFAYNAVIEPGKEPALADPDPGGRERQAYVEAALNGRQLAAWFRSTDSGRAVAAVAEPVMSSNKMIGAVIVQQGTDEILSLTNRGLARLMNVTLIAMLVVAAVLLGYASVLSRRIRHLSVAAEAALDSNDLHVDLPSSDSGDEIGDLSRSFGFVLGQLGDYNEYLRTLASKLSHELRTPLAIVTSSLDNLEHEDLSETAVGYTERAKDGADRLRKILRAMSEASRVEELMKNAELEKFDLTNVVESTVTAYRDVYADREFSFKHEGASFPASGSPELLIQMLDKLVDNAVSFSASGDEIEIALSSANNETCLSVSNPGPPLPERMRTQMFDSMVSMRPHKDNKHLGLGLYVAKLIADGHDGRIRADNIEGGVRFRVLLPSL